MCSGTCEESRRRLREAGQVAELPTSFWTFTMFMFGRKVVAWNKSTGLFPELSLEELVFLCCEYYSMFLVH
jgi:hypothetical protein